MPDEDPEFAIELHRCIDDLVYRYEPSGRRDGKPCWQRIDLNLTLHWSDRSGWIVSDAEGAILGRPWDVERHEQGPLPPDGIWVSRKGAKSYVYDHRHVLAAGCAAT